MKFKSILAILTLVTFHATVGYTQQLILQEHTNYHVGNWIVAGLIRNDGTQTVGFVEIEIRGYGENKTLVHTATTYAFSPIPPNTSIPFTFVTSQDDAQYIRSYGVQIINYSVGGSGTFQFEFDQLRITERNSSFHKWTGILHNRSGQLRQFVEIALMGFDTDGKLVYVDTTYTNRTSVPPDADSVFNFLVPPKLSEKVDRYRVIAYTDN